MELTEQNDTPVDAGSEGEELDDLFLSPEDSEGEIVAKVDTSGDVQAGDEAEVTEPEVIEMDPVRVEPEVGGAALDEANERIEALEAERDEVKNRMMRVAADLENFRKRAAREREDMRKYGIDKVVLELLPVLDNLERALQHAEANAEDNSITEGVRMVYRQFNTALGKHGVTGFESKGEPFDPQRHEAIQQVETDEFETGTVIEEYQKGYFLHERLIRPAMVSVAKNVTASAPAGDDSEVPTEEHSPEFGNTSDSDESTERPKDESGSGDEPAPSGGDASEAAEATEADEIVDTTANAANDDAASADEDDEGLDENTDVGM